MERMENDGGQRAERRKFTMKSLLERSGRGADGVVNETGPVRPSDDQSSAGRAVSSKPWKEAGEGAGRLHVSVLGSGGPRERANKVQKHQALTHAPGAVGAGDVASGTVANVAAGSVGAFSSVTHARDGAALVNVWSTQQNTRVMGSRGLLPPVAFQWQFPPWV